MSLIIYKDRAQQKRTATSGKMPTIPPSNDHSDGTWSDTDIYIGELYINLADRILFTRDHNDQIIEFGGGQISYVSSITEMNAITDPKQFQKVSVENEGAEYIYLNGSWVKQGQIFPISGNAITKAWLVGVDISRLMLLTLNNGDLSLSSEVSKTRSSDTINIGSNNDYDGIEVKIFIK